MDPGMHLPDATISSTSFYTNSSYPQQVYSTASTIKNSSDTACNISNGYLTVILPASYSIILIFGLFANILAIYVFGCIHPKWNSIQIYLLNVAIADLLLITCLPFRIMYHSNGNIWLLGYTFCRIVGVTFYMNMYISIVLLGLISVDRYLKITQTLTQYKTMKTKLSIFICSLLWGVSITATMPELLVTEDQENTLKCFHYRDKKKVKWKAYFNLAIVLLFWVVFIFLVFSYIRIANNLYKISKRKSSFPNSVKYNTTARKSFIVLFIFSICFVPYHTFRFIYIASQLTDFTCYWKNVVHKTNEIMLLFSALNSCMDPIMYFLLSNTVRKTVFRIICWKVPKDSSLTESTSEIKQKLSLQTNQSAIVDLNTLSNSQAKGLLNSLKHK
ncbi:probable G-protein coupled receptor 34 [Protopterus annectens]|uniref:probable G-protein coupled receptor 34 n=1 Tax=Protopterus annectens TaxID=7888 RepID=UPI001CFBA1B7|nr:probable G-protein coupled receptor 34 [Protopterus annectens]XP_043928271.1 probable G-protein coupled receptor 34 [Protopterus annectens]